MRSVRGLAVLVAFGVVFGAACSPEASDDDGRIAHESFSVVPPDGWAEPDDAGLTDRFELILDDPSPATGRLGVMRVGGLDDVRAYMMDTTGFGAGLRGLEPEIHGERDVEVAGAVEARVVDLTYTAQVDGRPRVRATQLVARRDDEVGFDLRLEALEQDWDDHDYDGFVDGIIESFRLD